MSAHFDIDSSGSLRTVYSDQQPDPMADSPGVRYTEFDRRPGLSFGMYWLDAGATDPQVPHTEDEIYVVIAGRGSIEIAGRRSAIAPGSVLSVPRDVEHRFLDIEEDLALAVVFGPPEGELAAS